MENPKTLTALTAAVVAPLIIISAAGVFTGAMPMSEYLNYWSAPATAMLGFWFRGALGAK